MEDTRYASIGLGIGEVSVRGRGAALLLVLALAAASCSNSHPSTSSSGTSRTSGGSGTSGRASTAVKQPGVTGSEIRVGAIASVTNPIGGQYGAFFDGLQAYFGLVNASGGVFGRKLALVAKRDDQTVQNQSEVQALLEQDNVFAAAIATLSFSGADTLVKEGVPTFGWNVNPEWGTGPNLFGDKGSFFGYTRAYPMLSWLARSIGAKRIAILSYSVPQSIDCAKGDQASLEKYGAAKVVVVDTSLPFGVTDLSADVAEMKKKDVDFVLTCLDQNGGASLGREMRKQGVAAPMYLPNAYDQTFIAKFADVLRGSYVLVHFTPFELPDKEKPAGLRRFLAQMKKLGKDPSEVALAGWLSGDMLATGLRAAGPQFTRAKVVDALNAMHNYDAAGILPGIDWTIAHRDDPREVCFLLLQIEGGKLVPRFGTPGKPFICFDRTLATLPDQPVRRG